MNSLREEDNWTEVAFSPDGHHVITVPQSENGPLVVWETETGRCVELIQNTTRTSAIARKLGEISTVEALTTDDYGRRSVGSKAQYGLHVGSVETKFQSNERRTAVAYFPAPLQRIARHPSRTCCAGTHGSHLYIVSLEAGNSN